MTAMLEKVAKAIIEEETRQIAGWTRDNESRDPIAVARAALLAIREPDEDVIAAGLRGVWSVMHEADDDRERAEVRAAMRWMIDAILGEKA